MYKLVAGLFSIAAGMCFAYDGGRLLREAWDEHEEEKELNNRRIENLEYRVAEANLETIRKRANKKRKANAQDGESA